MINIGPGDGKQDHKSNEALKINDLTDYFMILKNFLNFI